MMWEFIALLIFAMAVLAVATYLSNQYDLHILEDDDE